MQLPFAGCHPREGEIAAEFSDKMQAIGFSSERLIELAFKAPQWAPFIEQALGWGVTRVVLGTRALQAPEWFASVCRKFPDKIVAGTLMAVSEGMALAQKAGLPMTALHEALMGGAASGWMLDVLGQKMIDRDFVVRTPGSSCPCGRTFDIYDGGIRGRVDDMPRPGPCRFTGSSGEKLGVSG